MPIIGQVGRRSMQVRVLDLTIHIVLILGGVTMVYPFLVMLAGSVKSPVDRAELEVVPTYFYDDTMLYKKYIEAKYLQWPALYTVCNKKRFYSFKNIEPPSKLVHTRLDDWNEFLDESLSSLNELYYQLAFALTPGNNHVPEMCWKFREELKAEPDVRGDIPRLNAKYGTQWNRWGQIQLIVTGRMRRQEPYRHTPWHQRVMDFINSQDRQYRLFNSVDALFAFEFLPLTYGFDIRNMNQKSGTNFRSWQEICLSRTLPEQGDLLREQWISFVKNKLYYPFIELTDAALPAYREMLREVYGNRIEDLNKDYATHYSGFDDIVRPSEPPHPRETVPFYNYGKFIAEVADPAHLRLRTLEFMYRDFLKRKYGTIASLNQAQQFGIQDLGELKLPDRSPRENTAFQDDWKAFAVNVAQPEWVYADFGAYLDYRRVLTAPFTEGGAEPAIDFAAMNTFYGTAYEDAEAIRLPLTPPENSNLRNVWQKFLREVCQPRMLRLRTAPAAAVWQQYLGDKYKTAANLNKAYGFVYSDFDHVLMPTEQYDYDVFLENRRHLRREFIVRNYRVALDSMLYSGRAIFNTIIYCALSVLAALLVNPLAAYALSRYKLPSTYKILLFFMLTMAIPPMVLGIPTFIIIRKLHMLNTFAALILPAMANGYSIFLLKGFFDSLPRELYESASLDGASEWTMFWRITMATSKPILAVVALGAFAGAYGNFMLAFILCQDPKMWTMMVEVYQFMQRFSPSVSYAAIVIAAIPTLLVFLFCQNIIIRGIVVPTEK